MSRVLAKLLLLLVAGVALTELVSNSAEARGGRYRQYYSAWNYSSHHGYHYRSYHYLPTPYATHYQYHYVICYPTQPQYYYFYNPHTGVYWGRCSSDPVQRPGYSLLAPADRKGTLAEIPESAFGPLAALPAVPESQDGERLELPPADLLVPGTGK
jgi:hypothetical protein